MAQKYYYYKHHERQSEISKANSGYIVDLRRSLSQLFFYRAFWDLFIDAYSLTTIKFNGEVEIEKGIIEKLFTQMWPKEFPEELKYWRECASLFFYYVIDNTTLETNGETIPYDSTKDSREEPSIHHNLYENLIMWFVGILDKEDMEYIEKQFV